MRGEVEVKAERHSEVKEAGDDDEKSLKREERGHNTTKFPFN